MRRVSKFVLATAALGFAAATSPASAAVVVVGPPPNPATTPVCTAWNFSQNETKCAGGYEGNLLSGATVTDPLGTAALTALGALSATSIVQLTGLGSLNGGNGANVLN